MMPPTVLLRAPVCCEAENSKIGMPIALMGLPMGRLWTPQTGWRPQTACPSHAVAAALCTRRYGAECHSDSCSFKTTRKQNNMNALGPLGLTT